MSASMLVSNQYGGFPAELMQGGTSGTAPGGNGPSATKQAKVTVTAFADIDQLDRQAKAAAAGTAVYAAADKKHFDLVEGEMGFHVFPMGQSDLDNEDLAAMDTGSGWPKVQTSAAGFGDQAKALFPGNEEMQLAAMHNRIKILGPISGGHSYADPTNKKQGVAVQTKGVRSAMAYQKTPVGYYVRFGLLKNSQLKDASTPQRQGLPRGKAVLVPQPYLPKSIGSRWETLVTTYLRQRENFLQVMNPNLRRTQAKLAAMHAMFNFCKLVMVLGIDEMWRTGIIEPVRFNQQNRTMALGAGAAVGGPAGGPDGERIRFGAVLAHALGVTDKSTGALISAAKKESWQRFSRQLLMKVFFTGREANLGFGYSRGEQRNVGTSPTDQKILQSDPVGQVLYEQLNSYRQFLGAVNQACLDEHDQLRGPCIKGAEIDGTFDYLL